MELATQPFPFVQHEFRIFIEEEAFDRICRSADTRREVGGILVGEVFRDEGGPFIRVSSIIEALHAEESGTELTITHATWNHIHQQMDIVHTGKRIIGWYHTHPNFGVFLSERDRFIQQSFFDLPFQIALVYDPVRREHGIFAWRETKPWRVRRYWIGVNEHCWDDGRDGRDKPDDPTPPRSVSVTPEQKETQISSAGALDAVPQKLTDLVGNTWITSALLIGILFGFGLGWLWGKRNVTAADEPNQQTVREAIVSLDTDLLAILRGTLSDEAFAKTFEEGVTRLDRAVALLKRLNLSDPKVKAAVDSVIEAQQYLSRTSRDRLIAHEMLQQIEQVMRLNRTPEFVAHDLADQRAILAGIYVEMARDATRNKDAPRVTELLKKAMAIDPTRQGIYEQQLKEFEQRGTLSEPSKPADAGKARTPSSSGTAVLSPGSGSNR